MSNQKVTLTVTRGYLQEVMQQIVQYAHLDDVLFLLVLRFSLALLDYPSNDMTG